MEAEWGPCDEALGTDLGLGEEGVWCWRGTKGTVSLQGLQGEGRHLLRASCALGMSTERLLCRPVPRDATSGQ